MSKNIRCDLALEAREMLIGDCGAEYSVPGVKVEEEEKSGFIKITRVNIEDKEGEEALGKQIGNYITVEMPRRFYGQQEIYEEMCKACANELKRLAEPFLDDDMSSVLVVGLGNRNITADALGPKVMGRLMITRHLFDYIPEELDDGIRPVSAISPGVLGTTGIETGEVVKGISDKLKPNLIIVIDALCSKKLERVNTTVQFSDTGITPGAGVGNKRSPLTKEALNIPVIAIGVPTVVDVPTIARECIGKISEKTRNKNNTESLYSSAAQIIIDDKEQFIHRMLSEEFGNLVVAPKEVDSVIEDLSGVIANSINISLHRGITLSDVDRYV